MIRYIDADALIAPLREEYRKVKQAFDETSVFQAPNDVALYGALMQELGAVIGMIENAQTVNAVPVEFVMENFNLEFICDELTCDDGWCGEHCSYAEAQPECIYRYIERRKAGNGRSD